MSTGKRAIEQYIRASLRKGYSFKRIEKALEQKGYSKRLAEGIQENSDQDRIPLD